MAKEVKQKKLRVEISTAVRKGSDGIEYFEAIAAKVDKNTGTAAVIASTQSGNLKHANHWVRQYALRALSKTSDEVQFVKKEQPGSKKSRKEKEEAN